jgi:hypothetical protein
VVIVVCLTGLQTAEAGSQAITFVGETIDQTDFAALGFGQTGYYFPQFDASNPVTERPTDENMRFSVPIWLGFQFDITQDDRTFSPDAGLFSTDPVVVGVYSEGGDTTWDNWTLPALAGSEVGLSGSVVDLHTADNSNNTVNRIQLGPGVPSSFLLRVIVDNTNFEHNPVGRLRARGDSDNGGVDVDVKLTNLTVNGTTDIYTFRYDNFEPGDFIKIQLNSGAAGKGAGFGGLMFDVIPEPSSIGLAALCLVGLSSCRWRPLGSRRWSPIE